MNLLFFRRLGAMLLLGATLSSCVSVETAAPPVASLGIAAPSAARVECGRALYVGKCTKCHSPETVVKHDLTDWNNDILPVMTKKAKLSVEECDAVKAYVTAVCQHAPKA